MQTGNDHGTNSAVQGSQICHCEERSDVAISQYPAGSQEGYRRNRNCLPEIATAPSGPRNDKSGAITVLSSTCASCQRAAGSGMPLPYNGGCDQRDCLPEIAPQGHFLALRAQGATAPSGPRNDKSGAITVLSSTCASCQCVAGSGMPLPYNGVCDQRECLPEIATAPSGPRNDKSEASTVLTAAYSYRRHCAGPGCPRPYSYKPSHPNLQKNRQPPPAQTRKRLPF